MEASGFFKSARNFVGPEKVQCIKIISDNKKKIGRASCRERV